MATGLGFIVSKLVEEAPIFDGIVKDSDYRPYSIKNDAFECFEDAFKKFIEHYGHNHAWFPDYMNDREVNDIIVRLVHYGDYNDTRYKTTIAITKAFYWRKGET